MRGKDEVRRFASALRDLCQSLLHAIGEGLNKSRMVVERSDLIHDRRALTRCFLRANYVFLILPAARVGAVS